LKRQPWEAVPFTIETADHYARIRGTLGLSPAEAIHLASAAQAGTDLFLTNDKRLVGKIVPGIQFIASLDTLVKGALGDCVTVWYFKARGDAFLGANKALEWPGIAAGIL